VFPAPFVAASQFSCKQFEHIYVSKLDTAASYPELSGVVNRHPRSPDFVFKFGLEAITSLTHSEYRNLSEFVMQI
jgi:hypothetical protein